MLSDKIRKAILELQGLYPEKRSALIPALHLAQSEAGYLSTDVQQEIAELFNLELTEVNSIVTFYDMFFDRPVGKHLLHVCKNASCMLRGSDDVIHSLCQKLSIQPNGTTSDGEFTLIPSECLGACDRAPMMLADEKVVGPIKLEELDSILEATKKGPGHPSPVEVPDA